MIASMRSRRRRFDPQWRTHEHHELFTATASFLLSRLDGCTAECFAAHDHLLSRLLAAVLTVRGRTPATQRRPASSRGLDGRGSSSVPRPYRKGSRRYDCHTQLPSGGIT